VTGIESLAPEIDAKRVELLKAIVPGVMRVATLYSPNDQGAPTHFKYTDGAARALGVRVLPLEVRAPAHYDSVFAPLAAKPIDGLVMFTDPLTWADWKRAADFGGKARRRALRAGEPIGVGDQTADRQGARHHDSETGAGAGG